MNRILSALIGSKAKEEAAPAIPPSQYQSFEPGSGSSDSYGKLEALRLPQDLTGKRVLDLGCNHGFFCFAAAERGAAEVIGIDRDPKAVEAATIRAEHLGVSDRVSFKNLSWDEFSEGGFDYILLLSALHYAPDQRAFLAKIAGMLAHGGKLILEGGAFSNHHADWTAVVRGKPPHTDTVLYPTPGYMFQMLSERFAPREIGPSVIQRGDNISRFVWHCEKRRRMVVAVGGASRSGKTTLAFTLRDKGVPLIDVDKLLSREKAKPTPLGQCIAETYKIGALNKVYQAIYEKGLHAELAAAVIDAVSEVPASEWTITAMGVPFSNPEFKAAFMQAAETAGLVVWQADRAL